MHVSIAPERQPSLTQTREGSSRISEFDDHEQDGGTRPTPRIKNPRWGYIYSAPADEVREDRDHNGRCVHIGPNGAKSVYVSVRVSLSLCLCVCAVESVPGHANAMLSRPALGQSQNTIHTEHS